jgi:hypothetical protein
MELASANLEFEKAADLRDLIAEIKQKLWYEILYYMGDRWWGSTQIALW